jgi:hypothetical protein
MSGKSNGKAKEHAEYWTATEGSSEGSIMEFPSRAYSPRSITPKGTLFTNLGEAHQAITSRSASRSAENHIPETLFEPSSVSSVNASSTAGSAEDLMSVRHLEFTKPNGPAHCRCVTPFFGTASTSNERSKTPTDPSPIVSPFASSVSGSNSAQDNLNNGSREDSANSEPLRTGNTVEGIFDCYYMVSPMAEKSASGGAPQEASGIAPLNDTLSHHSEANSQSVNHRSPDIRRAQTGIDLGKHRWEMYHPISEPPQISLPELAHVPGGAAHSARASRGRPPNFSRPVRSVHSVSNSPGFTTVSVNGSQGSGLAVNYGRPLPQPVREILQDRTCQESDTSHASSNAGLSTDSDEDPFKYDRRSYTVFLQPSREREVSAALRRVSGESTASASGIFQHSPSQEPATPRLAQSNNPFVNRLQCYQAPILEYDWDDEDGPNEVKISVRSPPAPPSSPIQPATGLSEFVQGLESQRRRKDIHTLMSDGADWETVATSVGQFDSNRALASSTGLSGSHPVKTTGSSIADYSDTSSVHVPQFDAFSSRERILQYPATDCTPDDRYRRTLRDTRRPVFLPKPRIHRVNGYLQNTHRMFTDPTTGSSGNSTRSALVEKLSASIRSRSARKREHRRDMDHNNSERWSKSKFRSLDSLSSTYSEQLDRTDEAQLAGSARETGSTMAPGSKKLGEAAGNGVREQQHHNTTSRLLASSIPKEPPVAHLKRVNPAEPHHSHQSFDLGSPTLFSFPLISLEEAAQRVALSRENENDDDCTVTSGTRTRKNSSMDSSKATQRTTPLTPHLRKPVPTHSRRPTSASIMGISEAHRGYSGYAQGMQISFHSYERSLPSRFLSPPRAQC